MPYFTLFVIHSEVILKRKTSTFLFCMPRYPLVYKKLVISQENPNLPSSFSDIWGTCKLKYSSYIECTHNSTWYSPKLSITCTVLLSWKACMNSWFQLVKLGVCSLSSKQHMIACLHAYCGSPKMRQNIVDVVTEIIVCMMFETQRNSTRKIKQLYHP